MIKRILKLLIPVSLLSLYHLVLAQLAAFVYGFPSKRMIIIGVTGTKGKSTTTNLIARALEAAGHAVGITSTINFKIGRREWLNDKKMTMLGRFETQALLRAMVRAGCRYAVIETSSEGIAQWRHRGIEYDAAVLTNLTPEHIESHGSFERYRTCKERLFKHLMAFPRKHIDGIEVPKTMILNSDDAESVRLMEFPADKKITYGIVRNADMRAENVTVTAQGSSFDVSGIRVALRLLGRFNVQNALAAIATAHALGVNTQTASQGLETGGGIPGRQELIIEGQPFTVMVDYAYEPESQRQMYQLLNLLPKNRIIHVTGSAGGGRDTSRRSTLGEIAGKNADIVIVTNEDPYDEDPKKIIEAVAEGARGTGKRDNESLFMIADRGEAIRKSIELAHNDDLVLITGKGSEQAICVANGKKIPWDDRVSARDAIRQTTELRSGG